MDFNDRNKLNRLEELKNKLFSKDYKVHTEHHSNFMRPKTDHVQDSWGDGTNSEFDPLNTPEKFFMKTSRFKKFFIFSLIFFILTLGYASYSFFFSGNSVSNNNIDISILGNSFTAGGDDLSLVVGITNRNSSSLELVDLIIDYPKSGANSSTSNIEHFRQSIGSIPAGSTHNENVKIVLFGEQGDVRTIKVSIEYRVTGSNAIFVKEKPYEVTISSTPVNILVDAPTSISPNQNIVLNVKSVLNSTKSISNVVMKVDYPAGFQFVSADPAPSVGNNVWNMGDLSPGVDRDITISGKMIDVFDGEEKSFRVYSGSQSTSDKSMVDVVFNSIIHTVLVKKPFIEATLAVNGVTDRQYAVDSKNIIRGTINWSNNLDTKINDVEIRAKITGNAFNKKTVSPQQGTYNSIQGLIVWDKFSQQELKEVNPGDFGSVEFTINPIPLFSSAEGLLKDPTINVEVSITGKQLIDGYEPNELNNSESKSIKIISDAGLSTKALYYSGPFKNTGAIPPKVEKETTYTIVWGVSNTSNSISKGEVRAILPSWVRFMGPVSPEGENIVFNSSTREVVWTVGRIQKGTGISGSKEITAAFQVGLTPMFSQVGSIPNIVGESVLTGHDDFANVDIKVTRPPLRTDLKGDSQLGEGGSVVGQ